MTTFEIVLTDRSVERVDGADAYEQEGQLTTFFATDDGRRVIDAWSTRLASIRTSEVLVVRRIERCDDGVDAATPAERHLTVPMLSRHTA